MKYLIRKSLKEKIVVGESPTVEESEYIDFDKLTDEEMNIILDYYLMEKYPFRFERQININIITTLYKKSLLQQFNLKEELSKGNFIVNWIVPIVDDIKYNFNKNEDENTLNISISEFEQQITDYKRSFTNQNDTEKLIIAFSGYKNNLDGLNGINLVLKNNREVLSYNSGEYRGAFDQEILKVIGLKIERQHFQDYNYVIRNFTNHITDDTLKLKVNFKDNFKDEYFFNNRDEFDSTLEILNSIYEDYKTVLKSVYNEFENEILKYYKTKSSQDNTKKYVLPFEEKELRNKVITNPLVKDVYSKYYYQNKNTDSELANSFWLYKNIDEGMTFYMMMKLIDENVNVKNIEDLNKKQSDEIIKHYQNLILDNLTLINKNKLLSNYIIENINKNKDNTNKLIKFYWTLIQIFGENKYNQLMKDSKIKNTSMLDLLSKKEQEIYNDFVKKYDKKISAKENICEFDDLRAKIDSIPQFDIKTKGKLLEKLLDEFAEKNNKGEPIIPTEKSKDYIIYPAKKCDDENKVLACYHEVLMFMIIPALNDQKDVKRLNEMIQQQFEDHDEDNNQYICKYCKRYIRADLGINEEIEYDNNQGIIKSGNDTRNETSLMNKMSEYLFAIGRNDFNPRDLVEEIIEMVDSEIIKEANTKNFELKRDLIQISYIISIIISKIMISTNKYLNTSIHPIVNYTKEELINYFIKITEKINYSLFKKLKEYKLDLYRIIMNRLNNVADNIQNVAAMTKRLRKTIKENLDYNNNLSEVKEDAKYEKILDKKDRQIELKHIQDLIRYLEKRYMSIYQGEFFKPKVLNISTIGLDKSKLSSELVFSVTGIDNEKVIKELLDIKKIIDKLRTVYLEEMRGQSDKPLYTGRIYTEPEINEKYQSKVDMRQNIIDYFILRALDGTTQEYTYQGYSLIDGRTIENISNPSEKEFEIMKKKYDEIKTQDKQDVRDVYTYQYKPIKMNDKYKPMTDINEKMIANLVEKVISKILYLEIGSSQSSSTTEEDAIIDKNESFNSKEFITFLVNLGYYRNQIKEINSKITDKKQLERVEKENNKQRKELLKKYIIDLIILINLLKNKDNQITIKNFFGFKQYEKYFNIEKDFEKIKVNYTIDDINNIGRIHDLSDKKKGNILLNILVDMFYDNIDISNKINKFFTEYFLGLFASYGYYDVTQEEKDTLSKSNETDIFNTIKKINNITDEDRIELDIEFIDLRKVSDPTKFEDIIKRVDENRERNMMHDELQMDGEEQFNDEEFEVGEVGF